MKYKPTCDQQSQWLKLLKKICSCNFTAESKQKQWRMRASQLSLYDCIYLIAITKVPKACALSPLEDNNKGLKANKHIDIIELIFEYKRTAIILLWKIKKTAEQNSGKHLHLECYKPWLKIGIHNQCQSARSSGIWWAS